MEPEIDLIADLNAEDDEGLGWSTLKDARDTAQVRPGVMLVAGNRLGKAVVRVVAVDEFGPPGHRHPPRGATATSTTPGPVRWASRCGILMPPLGGTMMPVCALR
jgi:hypothetical protein